jgi:hypothetical protein
MDGESLGLFVAVSSTVGEPREKLSEGERVGVDVAPSVGDSEELAVDVGSPRVSVSVSDIDIDGMLCVTLNVTEADFTADPLNVTESAVLLLESVWVV